MSLINVSNSVNFNLTYYLVFVTQIYTSHKQERDIVSSPAANNNTPIFIVSLSPSQWYNSLDINELFWENYTATLVKSMFPPWLNMLRGGDNGKDLTRDIKAFYAMVIKCIAAQRQFYERLSLKNITSTGTLYIKRDLNRGAHTAMSTSLFQIPGWGTTLTSFCKNWGQLNGAATSGTWPNYRSNINRNEIVIQ